jgi:hypothetical protein
MATNFLQQEMKMASSNLKWILFAKSPHRSKIQNRALLIVENLLKIIGHLYVFFRMEHVLEGVLHSKLNHLRLKKWCLLLMF